MSATPRPWMVVAGADPQNKTIVSVSGAGNPAIATTRSESFADGCKPDAANAELIVRAVNAHDALVEALQCAIRRLESIKETSPEYAIDDDLRIYRAALKLAGAE